MNNDSEIIENEPTSSKVELVKRLKESKNAYKLFGFSHIIIIGSIADIMDSSFRSIIDSMYRRTKSHCKTNEESVLYKQRLCELYLRYLRKGLVHVDRLEPRLANILAVKVERPAESPSNRLAALRKKVAERTRRIQSLLSMQSRLKTDIVMAEWVNSKVEPIVYEAEKEIDNIESVSPNDFVSMVNSLNRVKNVSNLLELN